MRAPPHAVNATPAPITGSVDSRGALARPRRRSAGDPRYRFYGRLVARQYNLASTPDTPTHRNADGIDFVPTKPSYLFGQHFSAIAAAGPIVGPILACQQFGWLPSLLWIAFGVIFIGAVHDFTTLVASVRHDHKSIAEVAKAKLGSRAWLAMLAFIWLALIYVIVAFVDATAGMFMYAKRAWPAASR